MHSYFFPSRSKSTLLTKKNICDLITFKESLDILSSARILNNINIAYLALFLSKYYKFDYLALLTLSCRKQFLLDLGSPCARFFPIATCNFSLISLERKRYLNGKKYI